MNTIQILPALSSQCGPMGESAQEMRTIILNIMEPYNMHHVPSLEMDELELDKFYVALVRHHRTGLEYAGAAGYKMLDASTGKTTLLSVLPKYAKQGIGQKLQDARVDAMRQLGATQIITNADRPDSIAWYKKQGYQEIGKLKKLHSFGLDTVEEWTTLKLKL